MPESDLVGILTDAATAAIVDLRADLEREPQSIRGLTVELTIEPGGGLADAVSFLERRTQVTKRGLLDHHAVRAR